MAASEPHQTIEKRPKIATDHQEILRNRQKNPYRKTTRSEEFIMMRTTPKKSFYLATLGLALLLAGGLTGCLESMNTTSGSSATSANKEAGDYTILLFTHSGATHVADARQHLERAKKYTGWSGLDVIHKDGKSQLIWGKYARPDKASRRVKTAQKWKTPQGVVIFSRAMVIPIPGKDIGPKKWNLKHVDYGMYTFQIAIFHDAPKVNYVGRKRFAVEYCTRLREKGYEGYFSHGPNRSMVSVGLFGSEAVRQVRQKVYSPQGKPTIVNVSKILDPKIHKLEKDFPIMAINGKGQEIAVQDQRTGKTMWVPQKSMLVKLPQRTTTPPEPTAEPVAPTQPTVTQPSLQRIPL